MGEPGAPWPVAEWFDGADTNEDGALDLAEFTGDGIRWFAHLDHSGDGRIGYAELTAYEASLRNLRGFQAGEPRGDAGSGHGPGPAGGPPPRLNAAQSGPPGGAGRPGGPGGRRGGVLGYGRVADAGFFNLPQPVKGADFNIDQQVTAEEWAQATQRWFLALDGDHDGRLTLETLPETPLQRQASERPPVFSLGRMR
ncbi:hypothetical protein GVN24_29330 [Rhizobium sp. CRIBSB]|nr:hypothetical protein [Rhizobium sp. CRIBSB]